MLVGRALDKRFAAHIRQGGAIMPPFKELLKEIDIWEVTKFVQSLAKYRRSSGSRASGPVAHRITLFSGLSLTIALNLTLRSA